MFEAEIERGAKMLDEYEPGWELRIDLGDLQMDQGCQCVLGQTLGDFDTGCQMLGIDTYGQSEARAFLVPRWFASAVEQAYFDGVTDHNEHWLLTNDTGWRMLEDEWAAFIKRRLDDGVRLS